MAKKSAAELKAEGAELGTLIAAVRKRPHFFALLIGKEGLVLEAHPKKNADIMRRAAKAKGAGPKGAAGTMTLNGKVISLHCEDENFPGSLPKLAKKHFSERGLAYKVVMVLPGGGEMSDGEEEGEEAEAPAHKRASADEEMAQASSATTAPETGADEAPVQEVSAPGGDVAETEAPPDGGTDVTAPPPNTGGGDAPADAPAEPDQKAQILEKLRKNKELIETALASSNKKAAKKVEALSNSLSAALDAGSLDKAASTLTLLLKTAKDVAKRFPVDPAQVSGPVTLPDPIKNLLQGAWDSASEWVGDLAEDMVNAGKFEGKGLPDEVIRQIVSAERDTPGAVDTALADIAKMEAAKVQPANMAALLKLKTNNPKSFAAAMTALDTMDPGGAVDLSPAAIDTAMKTLQDQRNKQAAALEDWKKKRDERKPALKATQAAEKEYNAKKAILDAKNKAVTDFQAAHPPPLSPADTTTLTALQSDATAAHTDANTALTAWTAAFNTYTAKDNAMNAAATHWGTFKAPIAAAEADQKKIDDKRALLQALNFGPLSDSADPPLDDASREKMIAAYGACPEVGQAAIDLVSDAEDPTLIVENVGFISDKFTDGFADKDGNKIAASDDDRAIMAANALRMGAREGQGYFDGFKTYLENGDQTKPDPNGGDKPVPRGMTERQHKAAVNTKRASNMADALMDGNGKVNFETEDAKNGMDHMLYHPGSLRRPGPVLIDQVRGLEANFKNPDIGPGMQTTLDNTALPDGSTADGAKQLQTASKIVGGTVGKKPPAVVTDLDAKQAVMAAMISPLSQGPVGSCFTTATVRKQRQQDPAGAMAEFSQIASTGLYTDSSGRSRPADANPTKGENTLMRSWEYSVATAAADAAESKKRGRVNNALFGSGSAKNLNALGAADVLGPNWNDSDVNGVPVDGLKRKLGKAIDERFEIVYSAGPSRASDGGGDGRSESGVYDLIYDGEVIDSQEKFVAKILKTAFDISGETKDTPIGQKIKAIIEDPDFVDAILKSRGADKTYKPWAMPGGGFADETIKVLQGGTPSYTRLMTEDTTGTDPAVRTAELLGKLSGITSTDSLGNADDRPVMSTNGGKRGANHAFTLLPNDPSFVALKTGDMAANLNTQLIEPGAKIADTEVSAAECTVLFEKEVRRLARSWNLEVAVIDQLLAKRPTTAMKPAALKTHITTVMEDARKAQETEELTEWEGKQKTAPSAAQKEAKRLLLEESTRESMTFGIDSALVDKFDPPHVVIADTNWGGPEGQKLFVLAPDPASGDLRMWEKNDKTGKMTPCDEIWVDADWWAVNE